MVKNNDTGQDQEPAVTRTDAEEAVAPPAAELQTQSGDDYSTKGNTVVATRPGHEFNGSDKALPTITPQGVKVTAEQADKLIEEAGLYGSGLVFKVENDEK